MWLDGDWIVPHYAGRPWLERPPLLFWATLPLLQMFGDSQIAYRLPLLLSTLASVLIVGALAARFYGRLMGLIAALLFVTMQEVVYFAAMPQCDMLLSTVITAGLALFAYLELGPPRQTQAHEATTWGVFGRRSWAFLGFFAICGLTNHVKGLFFGDIFIGLPVLAYLVLGERPWAHVRRYLWVPGILVFLLIGGAWALAAYLRHPDILALWHHDYLGRVNQGYMREPWWYYLAHLPWVIFPWSIAAIMGMVLSAKQAVGQGRTFERFLWLWAIVPVMFFSIPQGKHHHYLLPVLPAWAILAALGVERVRLWFHELDWLKSPWPVLFVVAVPGQLILARFNVELADPEWLFTAVMLAWPMLVLGLWMINRVREPLPVSIAVFVMLIPIYWVAHVAPDFLRNRYAADTDFVKEIERRFPNGEAIYVLGDIGPLDASWMLYYLPKNAKHLHTSSFVRTVDPLVDDIYVIARKAKAGELKPFGDTRLLFESRKSRDEGGPEHRFGFYRLRIFPELVRKPGEKIYVSPMQATGRAEGPEID
jgi:4-amino-4-deoxy-L-arabinose transferase-like glycosyltransferase